VKAAELTVPGKVCPAVKEIAPDIEPPARGSFVLAKSATVLTAKGLAAVPSVTVELIALDKLHTPVLRVPATNTPMTGLVAVPDKSMALPGALVIV
jgi:hypothetical protein